VQRKFVLNLLLFLGLNLGIKSFWIFGIDRTVQNTVGEHVYGIYFALFNFSLIFNMLLDFGITSFNNRSVARSVHFLHDAFSRIFTLKLLLGLVYMLFVLIAGWAVGYNAAEYKLLILLGVNQFFASFILYLRSNISGLLLFKTDSFISVLDRIFMIIGCAILLWGNLTTMPFQIEWFIYIQTIAYLFTIALTLPIVLSKTKLKSPYIDIVYFKTIFRQSIPFALLAFLTGLHNRTDSILLERLLPDGFGAEQAGIYASAFRLLDAAMIIAYLFSVLLLPMFARMIAEKKSIHALVKISFTLIFMYGVVLAVSSYFYSYPFMELLYHNHVQQSSAVFCLLMMAIAPLSATYVFGSLLTANGNLRTLNTIAFLAVCCNIGLNMFVIPYWQATGSAIVSVFTQLLILILEISVAVKLFSFAPSKKYILKLTAFLCFTLVAGWLSLRLPFLWYIDLSILLIFSMLLILFLGLIKPKEIFLLFKGTSIQ
jgi:O-antigen/teichoic acid export membrane protein